MVYNWSKNIQNLAYPFTCILCGAGGGKTRDLCPGCERELPHNHNACRRCALPLPESSPPDALCGACQKRLPKYDRCLAALRYESPVNHLISGLKFRDKLAYGPLLAQLLGDHLLRAGLPLPEIIIPVPLHASRLKERGYNQALELARPLGKRLGLPLERGIAVRTRPTAPQTELDKSERRKNLKGAFELREKLRGRHIAVVDDVVTTGSTVEELTRMLRRAGAGRVEIWAAARRAGPAS